MQILIVGGGGREHAMAWKVAQSDRVTQVFVAPGNAGSELEDKTRNLSIAADDIDALLGFAQKENIDLTIVGPEAPLVAGLVDRFTDAGLRVFGPSAKAAQLEGSKSFSKDFLHRNNIPTARYAVFSEVDKAVDYIESVGAPIVVKANGLAAGKGVVVASTVKQAIAAVHDMLAEKSFGQAGNTVVIEEFLAGEEASFICVVDGKEAVAMASSQDHKARDDADQGPNTGGMGAYSPAPVVTADIHRHIMADIINPTVAAMAREGSPFYGFLYAGLMIDATGQARVIEFNVRLGDPETQPLMLRLQTDLVSICEAAIDGKLRDMEIEWSDDSAVGVVIAAGGYPGSYASGDAINGLDAPGVQYSTDNPCKIFHAGTRVVDNKVVTAGGRVLCATATGKSVKEAQQLAYQAVHAISWENCFSRSDIAYRAIARETGN